MPTLQEVTLAHSRRLSEIYHSRDVRLAEAQSLRDLQLRAVPAALKAYDTHQQELSAAREKQIATEVKAEAARHAALQSAIDRRGDRFEAAQAARRAEDIGAVVGKRKAEDAATRKYETAIAELRRVPSANRQQAAQDAERARRNELDAARQAHDEALGGAQKTYRESIDRALLDERRESRDAERAYLEAVGLGEAAMRGARSVEDQGLAAALGKIPEAAEVLREWRAELATIARETSEAEADAFSRFRHDLAGLKT